MVRTALNERGTSLVEILVSLLITAVVFTGLIQASMVVVNKNMENMLRDEAVRIAEERMEQARNVPAASLVSDPADIPVLRDFRGTTGFQFNTRMTVVPVGVSGRQVTIAVTWTRKSVSYNHNITTVVRI